MGKFKDLFFEKQKSENQLQYAEILSGNYPIYSQFGQNIYASDVVQQGLNSIVSEVLKTNPRHIRSNGRDKEPVPGHIQNVLNNPNQTDTTADYLEKITWNLLLNYNSFVYPLWLKNDQGKYYLHSLNPIQPTQVDFLEDSDGVLYTKLHFRNGKSYTVPYSQLIHIKYRYSVNDLMGGNEQGQPDNAALLKTLELNEVMLNGIRKSMRASMAVNGVIKYKGLINREQIMKDIADLESKLQKSESGFLGMDIGSEFIPIQRDIKLVDAETLKFIDDKILRNFGVPLCIVQGDYTKEQYEGFYQKTLEPIMIKIAQAHTKTLFTQTQKSFGNEIVLYAKELIFMTTDQKLALVNELSPTGALFENEKRTIFGFEPVPELVGKRFMSLNWVDVEIAQKYQLKGAKGNASEEAETEGTENDS